MSDPSSSGRRSRTVTAFFDTQAMAQKATDDLVAEGIPEADIRLTRGAGTTAVEEAPVATEHKGFWAELKDLFLPDEDRHSYAEGLTRGGHLLSVQVDEPHYDRVLAILDADGAIDMDAREADWRAAGWSGISAGLSGSDRPDVGVRDTTAAQSIAPTAEPTTASSLASAQPMTGQGDDVRGVGARDLSHGRTRLRSYIANTAGAEDTAVDFSPAVVAPMDAETVAAGAASTSAAFADKIAPHMDVVASDGATIGVVDHLDGPDRIKLTRNASPDGQHHLIPLAWVDHVDTHVHLDRTSQEAKAAW